MAESGEDVASLPMEQQLETVLRSKLNIIELQVEDISANCGNSFSVIIVSPDFEKKMTLARHRLVNQILAPQIAALHAFVQKTYTPAQWEVEKKKEAAAPSPKADAPSST